MADFSTTAHPYAKAVFELARDAGDYKTWSESLRAVAELFGNDDIGKLVANPALTRGDLAAVLAKALAGKVSNQAVSLVRLLVENGRINAIGAVAEQFEILRAEAERRVEVEIGLAVKIGHGRSWERVVKS